MDEKKLKKAAMNCLTFMTSIILISVIFANNTLNTIYAGEDKIAALEEKNNEMPVIELEETNEEQTEVITGERYIKLKKTFGDNIHVSLQDNYMERTIIVELIGVTSPSYDYKNIERVINENSYIGKPDNKKDNNEDFVKNIDIKYVYNSKYNTYTMKLEFSLDRVYAYSITQDEQFYYITMNRPKDIYEKIVVIDAGHGGNDAGTYPSDLSYLEKDFNLSMVKELKKLLDKEDIKVYYTRLEDNKVYLNPRVDLANEVEADFFLSIHCNSSESITACGTEVLFSGKGKDSEKSKKLANICLEEISNKVDTRNRGVIPRDDVYIISKTKVPIALVEVAYMSNASDLQKLADKRFRKSVSKGIYNAIMRSYKENLNE